MPWTPKVGRRVYVADRHRYPDGIVVKVTGEIVTLDRGPQEGLMPRFADFPISVIRRTFKEILD
jgi:hypothetical protein